MASKDEGGLIKYVSNATVVRYPGDMKGTDMYMDHVMQSKVHIFDNTSQIIIDDCENTTFVIGPCEGSVFIRDCKSCTLHVIARQIRVKNCTDINFYAFVPTYPVVESSMNIRFGIWTSKYPQLAKQFEEAKLDPTAENNYAKVHDFTPNDNIPKPHWSEISAIDSEKQKQKFKLDGKYGPAENPISYVKRLADHFSTMVTFGINTSQKQAQEAYEQSQRSPTTGAKSPTKSGSQIIPPPQQEPIGIPPPLTSSNYVQENQLDSFLDNSQYQDPIAQDSYSANNGFLASDDTHYHEVIPPQEQKQEVKDDPPIIKNMKLRSARISKLDDSEYEKKQRLDKEAKEYKAQIRAELDHKKSQKAKINRDAQRQVQDEIENAQQDRQSNRNVWQSVWEMSKDVSQQIAKNSDETDDEFLSKIPTPARAVDSRKSPSKQQVKQVKEAPKVETKDTTRLRQVLIRLAQDH